MVFLLCNVNKSYKSNSLRVIEKTRVKWVWDRSLVFYINRDETYLFGLCVYHIHWIKDFYINSTLGFRERKVTIDQRKEFSTVSLGWDESNIPRDLVTQFILRLRYKSEVSAFPSLVKSLRTTSYSSLVSQQTPLGLWNISVKI